MGIAIAMFVADDGSLTDNFLGKTCHCRNCLQWGRSNVVDPAEWPKIGLLNRGFGSILSLFPGKKKNSKTQRSLNFLQSGPQKFTKSDFSQLAPIQRVLSDVKTQFTDNLLSGRRIGNIAVRRGFVNTSFF